MSAQAELLREAARLMMERAKAATDGPWIAHPDGLVWTQRPIPGDPVSGSTEVQDAEHIASWHPTVAVAVAEWLDDEADRIDDAPAIWGAIDADWIERNYRAPLAVARTYLGGAR